MQNVVLFNGAADIHPSKTKVLASGAQSISYVSKKEYGQQFNLKGAALTKAHEKYRLERGTNANGNLSSLLAKGQIVAEKLTERKDGTGFSVSFTRASEFGVEKTAEQVIADMSTDELLAALEARKAAEKAGKE